MNSNNKTLQGLKKVNDRLLGIEIFLLALMQFCWSRPSSSRWFARYFLFICRVGEEFTVISSFG